MIGLILKSFWILSLSRYLLFANQTARDGFAVLKQGTSSVQDYVHAMQYILLEATDIDQEPINEDNVTRIRQLRENDLLLKNIWDYKVKRISKSGMKKWKMKKLRYLMLAITFCFVTNQKKV